MKSDRVSDETIITKMKTLKSQRKVAAELGIARSTLQSRLKGLALRGYAPDHDMVKTVPDGFTVAGVSTCYDGEGNVTQQWVKSRQDAETVRKMIDAMLSGLKDEIPKTPPQRRQTTKLNDDLLNLYTITDYHLGMLSWGEETGADWDLKIAEDTLVAWFAEAIQQAPAAKTAIFAQLGDFLHFDGLDPVTPTSKHVLDADTRFQKLVRVAIRVIRRVISMLLAKYERVHVILAEGNHDMASSIWLREWFHVLYENEPRVSIDTSADPYYCYEHGQTSLFFHHGHLKKFDGVDAVFAAKFRDVFGRTQHSYGHTGHYHHQVVKETSLMVMEQHRTLAASDAYASRGGWMSGRDAKVITYSKKHGEAGRVSVPISRVAN